MTTSKRAAWREVSCPTCRAQKGEYCRPPDGRSCPLLDKPHAARKSAAAALAGGGSDMTEEGNRG